MAGYQERNQGRGSYGGQQYRQPEHSGPVVSKTDLADILDGKDAQKLVKTAQKLASEYLVGGQNPVSTSQIRNIYGSVKILEGKGLCDEVIFKLVLLKPKLAYTAGRHDKVPGMKVLESVLSDAIDLVYESHGRFINFCRFFEAILAYHKASGGK